MQDYITKAQVLIEALPYIKKFYGKTVVIKYGGSAMVNAALKNDVITDIVLMKYVGMNPVIVHGGGPEISVYMQKLGKQPTFIQGLRVTDAETVEIAEMVLAGKTNKEIVALVNRCGGKAVGLSGKDGNLVMARKYQATLLASDDETVAVDLGFVGEVAEVNPQILHTLVKQGYIPVISPIGQGEDGETYNLNADTVAGEVAAALEADKLILLTDVEGIFRRYGDPGTLISVLKNGEISRLIEEGCLAGGMLPKVKACIRALEGGVNKAHIIDGRIPHALLLEIFTDQGIGTMVVKE